MSAGAVLRDSVLGAEIGERVRSLDWNRLAEDLDAQGNAMVERLLSSEECRSLAALYGDDELFRSRV